MNATPFTGKWDGDMLAVQTNGFKDGLWLDIGCTPLTDAAKVTDAARVTERYHRPNLGNWKSELRWTIRRRRPGRGPSKTPAEVLLRGK
jgi:hypothetical protein